MPFQFYCDQCGKLFTRDGRYRRPNQPHRFCSPQCHHAWRRNHLATLEERFWKHVVASDGDGCWVWRGPCDSKGRGIISMHLPTKHNLAAHRVSWELHNGPIPPGLFVCHNCPGGDNPRCVNPNHLFLGDAVANNRDTVAKGRHARARTVSKLSLTDIPVIRARLAAGESRRRVSKDYDVSIDTITSIVSGRSWRDVH